jgi:hypothetical protein
MSHTMTSQIGWWALSCMLLCKQGISLNSQGRARLRHVWLGWPKTFSAVFPFRWQISKCSKDTDFVLLLYFLTITRGVYGWLTDHLMHKYCERNIVLWEKTPSENIVYIVLNPSDRVSSNSKVAGWTAQPR